MMKIYLLQILRKNTNVTTNYIPKNISMSSYMYNKCVIYSGMNLTASMKGLISRIIVGSLVWIDQM